jgi:chromosome segregation ATPase
MAMTCNAARQDGWQNQAEHLTFTHVALGVAAIALAGKVQRRPSDEQMAHHSQPAQSELGDMSIANKRQPMYQLESGRVDPIPLQPREVHKIGSATVMRDRLRTLTARNALAERKIAELTIDLDAANETLAFQQNENNSLLTSLDLMTSEGVRQSRCLEESEATVKEARTELEKVKAEFEVARNAQSAEARSALQRLAACQVERDGLAAEAQSAIKRLKSDLVACQAEYKRSIAGAKVTLERLKGELAATQSERAKLSAALHQTEANHQAESNELKTRLSATISRAAAAEDLIKEVQRGLLHKLDSFQDSVAGKDYKIRELERSLSKLTAATNALLQSFKSRDAALASADDRLIFLAERVAQLEADAMPPPAVAQRMPPAVPQRTAMHDDGSRPKPTAPQAASAHCHEAAIVGAVRECLFEIHVTDYCGSLQAVAPNLADTLLAETINF